MVPFRDEIESRTLAGVPTLVAKSYRALVRIVGFFKYNLGTSILLRGQTSCYKNMTPSVYRGRNPITDTDMDAFLADYRNTLQVDLAPYQALTTEPLVQHYGIKTRWLDVVDSIPHALFFAVNNCVDSPYFGSKGGTNLTYIQSLNEYGFIYLLDCGNLSNVLMPAGVPVQGLWNNAAGLGVCDLRIAKSSIALRPHAQHGLLIRQTGSNDLWDLVVARIAVPLQTARNWIGSCDALSRESLFPPKIWDNIYGTLLSGKMNKLLQQYQTRGVDLGKIATYDFC